MRKRIASASVAAVLILAAGGCTVMESTYVRKVQEAEGLDRELAALRRKHQELVVENDLLKTRVERQRLELANTITERDKVKADLAYMTGARDKATADNKELETLLQAKSDTLSQTIGEMRRKVAELEAENGRLRQEASGFQKARDEKAKLLGQAEGEAERLRRDIAALKKADEEKAGQAAELRTANEKLRQELAAQRKAQEENVEKVSSTYEGLLEKMKAEVSKGEVTISELKGKLTLNMVDSILFDSGKAEVKAAGLVVLEKVVSILADVKDKAIRIEGHTDNVQIVGALAKQYPTNWELSSARAINVARYLLKQGIDPSQLSAVAYGDTRPIAGNDTPEGKAKNRRIEIILAPKE